MSRRTRRVPKRLIVVDHQLACVTAEQGRCEEEAPTPEQLVVHKRSVEHVRSAIAALPGRDRGVVELFYFRHHCSFEAVAKHLGVTRPYIFRIHARALARLRASLVELAS